MTALQSALEKRILVLDGAMGTMIQKYNLTEEDYRGERFAAYEQLLKGNNDLLCLTKPEIISDIHRQYLDAGADIITTCTFNAQRITMADYGMENLVREINRSAAKLARALADEYTAKNPEKPRFVIGSVGPTGKSLSISTNVNNPAARDITFDEVAAAYAEQIEALTEAGVDAILIETIFDTLNAKAAIFAAELVWKRRAMSLPVMLSATVADSSGRTLSGQTMRAFLASVSHTENLLSVGLNCSFGARDLKTFLKDLSNNAPCYVSAYPNAGLPNQLGQYDETPEVMAAQVREYIDEKLVNIIGGCCGTTPAHIAEYQKLIAHQAPRARRAENRNTVLSGLEVFEIRPENNFVNIGERCNVAGSKKFLRLIREKNYEEALNIAREQVENGAQIIDVNMDDALLDAEKEMVTFLHLIASEPEIARVPLMIDSSKWEVIEAGLKCVQGKPAVNSISLKEGEAVFLERAQKIRAYGAAVVVMAFDEAGQADTFERRIEICERAYRLLTAIDFPPQDIIFDPNVLAIGTGIEQHNNYAVDFIETARWIKTHLPYAKISGGISNLSFSFRGNNAVREAIHSVFLHHAVAAGLDMGIVNAGMLQVYDDIQPELLACVEDLVLNRRADATETLLMKNEELRMKNEANASSSTPHASLQEWRKKPLEDRIVYSLMKGIEQYLPEDLAEALTVYASPVEIVEKPLMRGMNVVGELFGEGKMFLPQVVKTARTMKKAVDILQPHMTSTSPMTAPPSPPEGGDVAGASSPPPSGGAGGALRGLGATKPKFLIATVKGDVHDIGKNIVAVILACNNYEVIDLGVMVPAQDIVNAAIEHKADIVGLSGLITPSLEEMTNVAAEMEKAGLSVPLFIGGAATSGLHTALKIAPAYSGTVVYTKDASQNVAFTSKILNADTKDRFIADINRRYETLRAEEKARTGLVDIATAQKKRLELFSDKSPTS